MTNGICEVEIESGKFSSGDSSCEILSGSMEVIGDGPGDKGFKNGGRTVEGFGLETSCIVLGSGTAVNIHQDNDKTELVQDNDKTEQVFGRTCEDEKVNGSENMELGSGTAVNIHQDNDKTEQVFGRTCEDEKVNGSENMELGSGTAVNIHQDNDKTEQVFGRTCEDEKVNGSENMEVETSDLDSEFENTQYVEVDVEVQALNKENVEIIDDKKEAQVMENVEYNSSHDDDDGTQSATEQPSEIDDDKKSQMAVMDSSLTKSINEVEQPTNAINDPITKKVVSMVSSEFIDVRIEDTDSKVHEVEDMIKHEPLSELEPLNSYRDQLVSNVGSQEEVQQTINQKNKIEEPLEILSNELNPLKDSVSKAEVTDLEIIKTLVEENGKGKQVQAIHETKSILMVSTVEHGKRTVSSPENKHSDYQIMRKVARKINHSMKTTEPVKFQIRDSIFACLNDIMEDEETEKTVVEFDGREESECKLKEQKPNEAMKNKKQKAKKSQKQAELRAQKEREKRLRKKERKRMGGENCMKDGNIENPKETNETENTNQKRQGPPQVAMTVERKRRCHQLGKMGMAATFISILFFLNNIIYVQ
ncbi:hypothetical protein L2E82_21841 [Cichorium intybus]|uniref:Uncharacterized protein n=1 Tax=Cichorium intybus TaxID=13427 RepID=A0ACB9DWI4_CICIN|nr:hypothetical protein L2E82_21841 [Cichorium intybus]